VDRQGIVHNAVPLVYFGVAMNDYHRQLPYDRIAADDKHGTGIHVVQASVTYKAPMRFDEEIDIGARVSRLGRTSLTFSFEIFPAGGDQVISAGEQVWVNTDRQTRRPVPWPEDFRALLRSREGERLAEA
jgi:acyl-CoA thioester hydrolase